MKIAYLFNPNAGQNADIWKQQTENFAQTNGIALQVVNILEQFDDFFANYNENDFSRIIIAGGDGTVNKIVNKLVALELNPTIAILPAGTANDYATHLKMPSNIKKSVKLAFNGKATPVDIGTANGIAFVNVCGIGNFMETDMGFNHETKRFWGKLSYYVFGFNKFLNMKPCKMLLKMDGKKYHGKFYLILVMCGTGAGSFANLCPTAKIDDGLFDVIALKKLPLRSFPLLFAKALFGTHLPDRRILHFQTDNLEIIHKGDNPIFSTSNLDGESGPACPLKIRLINKRFSIVNNL